MTDMALPKDGDFSKLLGTGENPLGFVSQTANGTYIDGRGSDGYQPRYWPMADGKRWNSDPRPEAVQDAPLSLGQPGSVGVRRRK
jgi:hypothetical protein